MPSCTISRDEKPYVPLQHLKPDQPTFQVYDSMLSEAAVLGFEFGYSLDSPNILIMWEAQFGDFANGAQVDHRPVHRVQPIEMAARQRPGDAACRTATRGRDRSTPALAWSATLQLCAEDNIQVCNASTPAQYFHLLRRQVHAGFRRPLVVMTPKSLLRHKLAVSQLRRIHARPRSRK